MHVPKLRELLRETITVYSFFVSEYPTDYKTPQFIHSILSTFMNAPTSSIYTYGTGTTTKNMTTDPTSNLAIFDKISHVGNDEILY